MEKRKGRPRGDREVASAIELRRDGGRGQGDSKRGEKKIGAGFFFFFVFLGLHLQHREIPSLGVELEL